MRNSKLIFFHFLVFSTNFSAAADPAECDPNQKKAEIQVQLEMPSNAYKVGSTIPARVTIGNVGSSDVEIPVLLVSEDYWLRFFIVGESGKPLKFIGSESNYSYSNNTFSLEPGYFYGVQIADLSKIYNLDRPGKYVLSVEYGRSPTGSCHLGLHRSNHVDLVLVK